MAARQALLDFTHDAESADARIKNQDARCRTGSIHGSCRSIVKHCSGKIVGTPVAAGYHPLHHVWADAVMLDRIAAPAILRRESFLKRVGWLSIKRIPISNFGGCAGLSTLHPKNS